MGRSWKSNNPKLNSFDIKVDHDIEFQIINVIKKYSFSVGYSIQIDIIILNDIPIKYISYIREAINNSSFPQWVEKDNIFNVKSYNLPSLRDDRLQTKNIKGTLYSFQFGFEYKKLPNGDYDTSYPCIIHTDLFIKL